MLHRRHCEVRVCQARHLRKRNGDDKAWVLLSMEGKHHVHPLETPSWRRVAVFDFSLLDDTVDSGRGEAQQQQQQQRPLSTPNSSSSFGDRRNGENHAAASSASATWRQPAAAPTTTRRSPAAASASSASSAASTAYSDRPTATRNPFAAAKTETQSLNPFASNFVPPPSSSSPSPPSPSPPASPPAAAPAATPGSESGLGLPSTRRSLVLHLRVLTGRLRSKEVLGDVAIDLVPVLRSGGDLLATDRLGWLVAGDGAPLEGLLPASRELPLAVDTWVSLRQGTAELRIQLLVKPSRGSFPGSGGGSGGGGGGAGSRHPGVVGGGDAWCAAFDTMTERGLVKTTLDLEESPLDERLLAVQELYDFSAVGGYRTGKPDGDDDVAIRGGGKNDVSKIPEWPASGREAAQLRRDMKLAALRHRRQSVAWAEKLWSSAELQQALRHPPAIGAKAGTTPAAAPAAAVTFEDLRELIAEGIPAALQQESAGDPGGSSSPERGGGGDSGAFMIGGEEEEEEASLLDGVVTAIPRVEVVRVSGTICCAEYQLQVTREPRGGVSGDSWCVLRRYSDFSQLYEHLPRKLHAPMPPKSWRSFSYLSMTPEFLEDRRVALEVALRRLTINAVESDTAVQAHLRAFLGFPPLKRAPSGGVGAAGRLAGVDAEVARHLARVPVDLELALPGGSVGLAPVPLLGNLRVVMWMLLSGAAHKVSVTDRREQYKSLAASMGAGGDEAEWCRRGGSAKDYARAALAFETIRSDVNRTNVSSSAERERMRRVLRAFALKEPRTGYCQGMNSVALFLLRTAGGREDLAFWLLDALATAVVPGHWEQLSHISTAGAGIVTIRLLLAERAPHLLEHLDRNLPPEVLLCDFMLSLGCRSLPPTTLWRCFDFLFLEGGDALLYITLAVLLLAEKSLLSVRGAPATSETLAKCAAAMHDADRVIETARSEMEKGVEQSGAAAAPF